MTQDSIEREVTIEAPVERVWSVITEAEHLGRWFGDAGAEIDLRPGGEMTMRWESGDTARARVEAVEPPRRFAYRWFHYSHGDDGGEHTPEQLHRRRVHAHARRRRHAAARRRGGFAALDAERRRQRADYEGNMRGWQARARRARRVRGEGGHLTARPAPEVLAALADPTRWQVLSLLAERGEGSATTLAGEMPVSRVAVLKHLAVLDRAGLVTSRRAGREVLYTVRPRASAPPPPTWRRSRTPGTGAWRRSRRWRRRPGNGGESRVRGD